MNLEDWADMPFANQPLRFKPIILEKIWGGSKLNTLLGKELGDITCAGESWELSSVDNNLSIVSTGVYSGANIEQLLTRYGNAILGSSIYSEYGNKFPLLIKFLDSKEDLSIQVHPGDKRAMEKHNCLGKTEFWYVINADENSRIISGFNKEISKDEYLERIQNNTLEEVLDSIPSTKGSSFFIPAGRVHALCAGNVVAEIQQTSDITYRIFDYNRIDKDGKARELHTELALESIDFSVDKTLNNQITPHSDKPSPIVDCIYFKSNVLKIESIKDFDLIDRSSFTVLIIIEGVGTINYDGISEPIKKGDTLLLPAIFNRFSITATASPLEFLEVYI